MDVTDGDIQVVDNPDQSRYEMSIDGKTVGFIDYLLSPPKIVLSYIEVAPAYGGHGLGGKLTAAALQDCRTKGLKVSARCPFIADYIRARPEYHDLLAG